MTSILDALDLAAEQQWTGAEWRHPNWKKYIKTGDKKLLPALPSLMGHNWLPKPLLEALGGADDIDESGQRFLRACIESSHSSALGEWLRVCAGRDAEGKGHQFEKGCKLLLSLECPPAWLAMQVISHCGELQSSDGSPTAAGAMLLSLKEAHLQQLVSELAHAGARLEALSALFATHAAPRWKALLESFAEDGGWDHLPAALWVVSLVVAPKTFQKAGAQAFHALTDWDARFAIGEQLANLDPDKFRARMQALATSAIDDAVKEYERSPYGQMHAQSAAKWLAAHAGVESRPLLVQYFATWHDEDAWRALAILRRKSDALDAAVAALGRDAVPLIDATFARPQPALQLRALEHLMAFNSPDDAKRIADGLRSVIGGKDGATAVRGLRLAAENGMAGVEPDVWAALGHKSRQVRNAAAIELAKLGDSRISKAKELWAVRKADARVAAVAWLTALGTPGAIAALKARLDDEESDDVRDAIFASLDAGDGAGEIDRDELDARIARTVSKLGEAPASWLQPEKLPSAKLKDGTKLKVTWLRYLLYRQSRVKEIRADVEARSVYAQLERATTGDLALAVAKAYFASKADSDDRWAMAFAALLGDDRLVPLFTQQVKTLADSNRGKLAEFVVQALALLGTDAALVAVDTMAIRYRTKNKNIGKAASDAFADAAEVRGVTVEELGDLVVPWLGFAPATPRIVATGKGDVEVRIGTDLKLAYRDVKTGKALAKLPAGASAQAQAELKEGAAALKEAAKSQLMRMEALLVRQFRWPRARWEELFLSHPLLQPFAQRLVWGAYDAKGALLGAFRALDDGSLTDAKDALFKVPAKALIGIVHPLDLAAEQRAQWLTHLADYDVTPPFPQLERSVIAVKETERDAKFGGGTADTTMHALTFRGRAERCGWTRGSVTDGGAVGYYRKTFPGSGVDAFLELHDMYVSVDPYADVSLGNAFFVRHGSVRVGSYVYDEPGDPNDERLVAFGDVPPIAFSEAMGELARIAGTAGEDEGE